MIWRVFLYLFIRQSTSKPISFVDLTGDERERTSCQMALAMKNQDLEMKTLIGKEKYENASTNNQTFSASGGLEYSI